VSRSFDLPDAESVTVGTVGEPGRRTFYLQLRNLDLTVTLKLEKEQVAGLSQYLSEILSDLPAPSSPSPEAPDLTEPLLAEWAVGVVQLAYHSSEDRIVIIAEEVAAADADSDPASVDPASVDPTSVDSASVDPASMDDTSSIEGAASPDISGEERATVRFSITTEQASALARRGFELVEAGRPPCPLCGHPIDPEGHSCPRTNGHRPPTR
jgi:uncharacterized repeat protein (TIGR03847 family)